MAETRRTYTDEDKQKILAHAAEHGPKVAAEHFKVATSMINRWRHQAGELPKPTKPVQRRRGEWAKKKWTDDKIAAVVAYLKTHTHAETKERFKVSSSQISVWRRGLPYAYYKSKKHKANGAHPVTNGLGQLPERDALMWMQRWRDAYFAQLKAETPSAASVLAALRGGK